MTPPHFRGQKKAGERQAGAWVWAGSVCSDLVCPGCPESLAKVPRCHLWKGVIQTRRGCVRLPAPFPAILGNSGAPKLPWTGG